MHVILYVVFFLFKIYVKENAQHSNANMSKEKYATE